MTAARRLIVNADDFGQSAGVNRGVIRAHRDGIVTSASLMVRWPAAPEAAALARDNPALAVGLHLDLGEWTFRDGDWFPRYEVVAKDDAPAVRHEAARQLSAFQSLLGRDPTHIDSHQHVHMHEPVRSVIAGWADALAVPVRGWSERIRYCGDFYGQDTDGSPLHQRITVAGLLGILERLPAGVTELCCHPSDDDDLETMYRTERRQELAVLCDTRIRAAMAELGIQLCSFREVGR